MQIPYGAAFYSFRLEVRSLQPHGPCLLCIMLSALCRPVRAHLPECGSREGTGGRPGVDHAWLTGVYKVCAQPRDRNECIYTMHI